MPRPEPSVSLPEKNWPWARTRRWTRVPRRGRRRDALELAREGSGVERDLRLVRSLIDDRPRVERVEAAVADVVGCQGRDQRSVGVLDRDRRDGLRLDRPQVLDDVTLRAGVVVPASVGSVLAGEVAVRDERLDMEARGAVGREGRRREGQGLERAGTVATASTCGPVPLVALAGAAVESPMRYIGQAVQGQLGHRLLVVRRR